MVLELAYVSDRPSLVDVQWSVSTKVLDSVPGNPKPMTHQPHEEPVFVTHKQSHKNPINSCLRTCNCEHKTLTAPLQVLKRLRFFFVPSNLQRQLIWCIYSCNCFRICFCTCFCLQVCRWQCQWACCKNNKAVCPQCRCRCCGTRGYKHYAPALARAGPCIADPR